MGNFQKCISKERYRKVYVGINVCLYSIKRIEFKNYNIFVYNI